MPLELLPYQILVTLPGSGGTAYRQLHKDQVISAASMKVEEWETCRCVAAIVSCAQWMAAGKKELPANSN